jgi:hypothetical protein
MARPTLATIDNGAAAWDGDVNDNFSLLADTPLPIATYANAAALPTASSYEDCLAVAEDTDLLYISDGSSWSAVGGGGTFLTLTDTPSSYSGMGGRTVKVNVGETALEFVDVTTPADFTDLGDVPSSYSGQGGKVVKVNVGETALEFDTASTGASTGYSKVMGRFISMDSTEADTGMRWTDNAKIYCKYVDNGTLQNAGTDIIAHGITGLGEVVEAWAVIAEDNFESNDDYEVARSLHNFTGTGGSALYFDATNARLRTDWDASGHYGRVYMLYTKSGGGTTETEGCLTHSTTEQATGWSWIDGRMIYVKTVDTGGFPNATQKTVAHSISDFSELVHICCTGKTASGTQMTLPRSYSTESTDIKVNGTNIYIKTTTDRSTYTSSFTTLYYTKDEEVGGNGNTRGVDFSVLEEKYAGFTQGSQRVYMKTFDVGALPNATTDTYEHGIQNLTKLIGMFGVTYDDTTELMWYPMPLVIDNTGTEDGVIVTMNRSVLTIEADDNMSRFIDTKLTVLYTKEYEDMHEGHGAYSETETPTGERWIDGSMIYKKTVSCGALPDASPSTTVATAHGISSLDTDKVIKFEGASSNGTVMLPMPRVAGNLNENVMVWVDATNITTYAGSDLSAYDQTYITIYWVK